MTCHWQAATDECGGAEGGGGERARARGGGGGRNRRLLVRLPALLAAAVLQNLDYS